MKARSQTGRTDPRELHLWVGAKTAESGLEVLRFLQANPPEGYRWNAGKVARVMRESGRPQGRRVETWTLFYHVVRDLSMLAPRDFLDSEVVADAEALAQVGPV